MAIVSSGQLTLTDLNDTKQVILYLNANYKTQVYDPTGGSYSPSFSSTNLVITPELYIAGGNGSNLLPSSDVASVKWYEGSQTTTVLTETTSGTTGAGYSYSIPTGSAKTVAKPLTIKSNLTNSQKYTCVIVYTDPDTQFDITIKADVEILRVQNGAKGTTGVNAITAFASNSSVTLPATNAGAVSVFTGSGTDIYVYDGTTTLKYVTTAPANGEFNISTTGGINPANGVTLGAISASGTSASNNQRATVANITAFATANDVVTVTYTITGKSLTGASINATVMQTFNKSKQALDGSSPTTYWMSVSTPVIQKNASGVFSPTSVTATGFKQTGTGSPVSDASYKFRIDYDNGSGFVTGTPTGAVASATTTTYNAGLKAIRIRMYPSSVTPSDTNFIDEEIVMVVSDGTSGIDAYFLNVWTPRGDTIRNANGTLDLQADLYKGGATVVPTAFKWYIQDITATSSVGGDSDGGNGWRLITVSNASTYGATNYTTAKMTITEKGIAGVAGYMCIATAPTTGTKYKGVVIVKDFQDPIVVNIIGASVFKNGEGELTFKVQLLQAGAIIPNTGYTFAWAIYNANGTLKKVLTGNTDTIKVNADDIDGTGNLVCDVSK